MAFILDPISQDSVLGLMVLNQNVTAGSLTSDKRGIYYSRLFQKPDNHVWYQISMTTNLTNANFQNVDIDTRYRTGSSLPFNYAIGRDYTFDEFNALIKSGTANNIDTIMGGWQLGRSLLGISGTSTNMSEDLNNVLEMGTFTNSTKLYPDTFINGEVHNIGTSGTYSVALDNSFVYPTVRVSGYSYTTKTPNQGQFRLSSKGPQAGLLTFNKLDSGKPISVQYEKESKSVWNYWSQPNLHNKFYIAYNGDHKYAQLRIDMTSLDQVSPVEVYKIIISSILKKG
jgi:hypothetical protein